MLKLIIFDWDDVFTNGSTDGYFRCYRQALTSVGVRLDPEEEKRRIFANWGRSAQAVLQELLKENSELLAKANRNYEEILMGDSFVNCLSIVPGAVELLKKLKDHFTLCIATGVNPVLLREKIMPKFGIPDVFSQIVSVYDISDPEKGKPHPFMVERILTTQNIKPEDAILVGDAKGDVLMARNAGIEPVVVLTGHLTREQAQELGVEYIIPDVTRLEDIISTRKEREV